MTTLADLQPGDEFLFACRVSTVDQVAGMGLVLYGPDRSQAATAQITPAGVMSGQLALPPGQTPVTVITGFAPLSVGDILENRETGETMAVRWSSIDALGTVSWSPSVMHTVIYPGTGWTVIGHLTL